MSLTPPPLHGDDLFDDDAPAQCGLDLAAVCEQAVARVRDDLLAKHPIDVDFGPHAEVAAPRADFFQVMVNILLNAEDVVARGDAGAGRVLLRTRGGADHAIVEVHALIVSDRGGPPAPPRVRWEQFGMPVCEKILGAFGGTLALQTDLVQGAIFRVTVPVPRSTVRPPPRAEGAPPPSLSGPAPILSKQFVTPAASFPPGGLPKRAHTREMFAVVPPAEKKSRG